MSTESPARTRRALLPFLAIGLLLGACADGTSPDPSALSGRFALDDWFWISYGDSLPLTSESYIDLRFGSHSEVEGEGYAWLVLPRFGNSIVDTVPILTYRAGPGDLRPLELRGWYSIHLGGEEPDTLRFRFQRGFGSDTWLENFDWILSDDRRSFRFDLQDVFDRLRIVYRRQ